MSLSEADAAHLLRRSGFGATPASVEELVGLGTHRAAVARVMDVGRNPAGLAPIDNTKQLNEELAKERTIQWWLQRMGTVPSPIEEKLVLFWHGHITSEHRKVMDMGLLFQQHQVLRANALGLFGNLAHAVSLDPAMLLYLDNWANVRGAPQENFGRELLELFTLGTGSYSEADVVAMARAWTGHGLAADQRTYQFHASRHDGGSKTLFGITGRWDGPATIDEVLFGVRAGESSRFIAAKLFSYLAYPVTVREPIVEHLAARFRASHLNIWALVRDILLSAEFWSPIARRAIVRSPVEWYVAALQGAKVDRSGNPRGWMEGTGQVLFDPPNVSGWRGGRTWISTSGAAARLQVASLLRDRINQQLPSLAGHTESGAPAEIVDAALRQYGIFEPSPATRARLIGWVEQTRRRDPGGLLAPELAVLVMCSPDFQLA